MPTPLPDEAGVPLEHYLTHPGCCVRFTCRVCEHSFDVPVSDVIERLRARGLGGERTGIREVAQLADQPCARCGAIRWETRPGFSLE